MSHFIDFVLHFDRHLVEFVQQYGTWVYGILFAIIFAETGLVVTPFLPGDSLLFAVGALSATGVLNPWFCYVLLIGAAILGDGVNYSIGRSIGPRLLGRGEGPAFSHRLINPQHIKRAHEFFELHGGKAVVLARFVPIVRTFTPIVAGVAEMKYSTFVRYNIVGGLLWGVGVTTLGYYMGQVDVVRNHVEIAALIIVAVSLIPVAVEFVKHRKAAVTEDAEPVVSDT